MGMYGAVGAPATAASARYSEFSSVPQGQPMSSQAGAIPTRSEVAAAEYGAGYGAYGKCNYGGWGWETVEADKQRESSKKGK